MRFPCGGWIHGVMMCGGSIEYVIGSLYSVFYFHRVITCTTPQFRDLEAMCTTLLWTAWVSLAVSWSSSESFLYNSSASVKIISSHFQTFIAVASLVEAQHCPMDSAIICHPILDIVCLFLFTPIILRRSFCSWVVYQRPPQLIFLQQSEKYVIWQSKSCHVPCKISSRQTRPFYCFFQWRCTSRRSPLTLCKINIVHF